MGVLFVILLAIGGVIAYPDNVWAWGFFAFTMLGSAGLVWRHWLSIRSEQAMIDLERRNR